MAKRHERGRRRTTRGTGPRLAGGERGEGGKGGARGDRGDRGARGKTSARGDRGERGVAGPPRPAGPPGHTPSRADVLAMVDDQFMEIRKKLGLQLTRMGQIQTQLDQIHALVKELVH
jgi:hypothetical protein